MKFILGLVLLWSLVLACKNNIVDNNNLEAYTSDVELNNRAQPIDSVVYIATTRGYYEKVIISNASVLVTNDRAETEYKKLNMAQDDWEKLVKAINTVGVESIPNFEPPSNDHQVDAAALAHFTIYSDKHSFESKRFDHKNPPKALASIAKIIYDLTEKVSNQ